MSINLTLIAQALAFAGLIWLIATKVWPPLLKAIEERQVKIAEGLAAAEEGRRSLADASSERDKALAQTRAEAQEVLAAANKQASQIVEEARATARAEADRIRAAAQADVESEIGKARDALRKQVGELAVLGAARIVKREIDQAKHAEVLSDLAARLR
mgnify:FL=1